MFCLVVDLDVLEALKGRRAWCRFFPAILFFLPLLIPLLFVLLLVFAFSSATAVPLYNVGGVDVDTIAGVFPAHKREVIY